MAPRTETPTLSPGNHIYLYRLLRDTLGAGKQTFLPAVEEALASEHLGAEDLGFTSTRELLEALDDFISLKIFKGNRIYATVVAQPAWDEALSAGDTDKGGAKAGGKSWKRKKSDKALRAVKPRRIKRPEPEPKAQPTDDAAASMPGAEPGIAPEVDTPIASEVDAATAPEADAATAPEAVVTTSEPAVEVAAETGATAAPEEAAEPEPKPDLEADAADDLASKPEPEPAVKPSPEHQEEAEPAAVTEPEPSISFTILYDPTEDNEPAEDMSPEPISPEPETLADKSETQTAATAEHEAPADATEAAAALTPASPSPVAAEPATPAAAAAPEVGTPSAAASAAPASATPAAPTPAADYPLDFTREVYCPGDLLLALTHLLPYGADVLGILSAYFDIARLAGTLEGTRSRATFPVAYIREGARHEVLVTIKRRGGRATAGDGAAWSIASVEHDD